MSDVTLTCHDHPPDDAAGIVDHGLGDYNQHAAPLHEVRPVLCIARDAAGQVVGGAVGRRWGALCELQQLWVHEAHRGAGLGSRLLRGFEAQARGHGCTQVYLETFSFQAPGFYARLGYRVELQRAGFPHGIGKFHMARNLLAEAAD